MSRRVVAVDAHHRSLARLGDSPDVLRVVAELVNRAIRWPDRVRPLPGTRIRVLRSQPPDASPAVRLFYAVDADTVYLLWVDRLDLLEEPR